MCGFPPEFCLYGPSGKKWKNVCGPWHIDNMDDEHLLKYELISLDDELAEGAEGLSLDEKKKKGEQTTKTGEKVGKDDQLKPGGKVASQSLISFPPLSNKNKNNLKFYLRKVKKGGGGAPRVTVEKLTRNKRKFTTVVTGVEAFGIDAKDASKVMKKKFSCGVAACKGDAGKPNTIEIQGDFLDDVLEMLAEHKDFKSVPEEAIYIKDGNKVKAYAQ